MTRRKGVTGTAGGSRSCCCSRATAEVRTAPHDAAAVAQSYPISCTSHSVDTGRRVVRYCRMLVGVSMLLVAAAALSALPVLVVAQQPQQPSESQPAFLANLTISVRASLLTPAFTPDQLFYSLQVPARTSSVQVTASAQEPQQARISATWNLGAEVNLTSGQLSPSFSIDVNAPYNQLQLKVVRPPLDEVTYVVDVLRNSVMSTNAQMFAFEWMTTPNQPSYATPAEVQAALIAWMEPTSFSSLVHAYVVQLASGVTEVRFRPGIDAVATIQFKATAISIDEYAAMRQSGWQVAPLTPPLLQVDMTNGEVSPVLALDAPATLLRLDLLVVAEDDSFNQLYTFVLARNDTVLPLIQTSSTAVATGGAGSETGINDDGNNVQTGAAAPNAMGSSVGCVLGLLVLACGRWL